MRGIVEISQRKAECCEAWTVEDHRSLVDHLAQVSRLAQAAYEHHERNMRELFDKPVYRQTNGAER